MTTSSKTDIEEITVTELKKPKKWAVVIHNDDVTTMNFVVILLCKVFRYDLDSATELMFKIHTQGKAVAGIYNYEIAQQKYAEAIMMITMANQVLKITLEEES